MNFFRIAALFGLLGVGLGAFGAHGLKDVLAAHGASEIWKTASFYHLLHAVALLVIARMAPLPTAACWLFAIGIIIFSGSLYLLALTDAKWLGAITPLGGLSLMAGWLALLIRG